MCEILILTTNDASATLTRVNWLLTHLDLADAVYDAGINSSEISLKIQSIELCTGC